MTVVDGGAIVDFYKFNFLLWVQLRGSVCVILQNFVAISQTVAEFGDFSI